MQSMSLLLFFFFWLISWEVAANARFPGDCGQHGFSCFPQNPGNHDLGWSLVMCTGQATL